MKNKQKKFFLIRKTQCEKQVQFAKKLKKKKNMDEEDEEEERERENKYFLK